MTVRFALTLTEQELEFLIGLVENHAASAVTTVPVPGLCEDKLEALNDKLDEGRSFFHGPRG